MATIQRFEDMIAWKKARELTKAVYGEIFKNAILKNDRGLSDQITRASVSVMSNIAEGFESGTKQEFLNYLYIAKGSAGEVRCQLYVALDAGHINIETFKYLKGLAEESSRLVASFIVRLKRSEVLGLQRKPEKSNSQIEDEQFQLKLKKDLYQSNPKQFWYIKKEIDTLESGLNI